MGRFALIIAFLTFSLSTLAQNNTVDIKKDYYSGAILGLELGGDFATFGAVLSIKDVKGQIENFESSYRNNFVRLAKYVKAIRNELETIISAVILEPEKVYLDRFDGTWHKLTYLYDGYEHVYYSKYKPFVDKGELAGSFLKEQLEFFKELYASLEKIHPIDDESLRAFQEYPMFKVESLFYGEENFRKIQDIKSFLPEYKRAEYRKVQIVRTYRNERNCSEQDVLKILNDYLPASMNSNDLNLAILNFIEYVGKEKNGVFGIQEAEVLYGRETETGKTLGVMEYLLKNSDNNSYKEIVEVIAWVSLGSGLCSDRDIGKLVIGFLSDIGYLSSVDPTSRHNFMSVNYNINKFESDFNFKLPLPIRERLFSGVCKYATVVKR